MKLLLIALTLTFSGLTLASTCSDLQKAEEKITSAAFYGVTKDVNGFCFFLSRAVSSTQGKKIGLDGLVQGGIELCVNSQSKISTVAVAKETNQAIKAVKGCFSNMGQ